MPMFPLRVAAALAAVLAAAAIAAVPQPARADIMHVTTRQGAREAIVLQSVRTPAPTVIVLHGATITAAQTARSSGFAEAAAAGGFAAVFPQGVNRQWNDGREDGRISSIDDVGFLRQLVDELVRRGIADRERIYLAGISNGGMMTFRMLCEASELFAGAATIIANMPATPPIRSSLTRAAMWVSGVSAARCGAPSAAPNSSPASMVARPRR